MTPFEFGQKIAASPGMQPAPSTASAGMQTLPAPKFNSWGSFKTKPLALAPPEKPPIHDWSARNHYRPLPQYSEERFRTPIADMPSRKLMRQIEAGEDGWNQLSK